MNVAHLLSYQRLAEQYGDVVFIEVDVDDAPVCSRKWLSKLSLRQYTVDCHRLCCIDSTCFLSRQGCVSCRPHEYFQGPCFMVLSSGQNFLKTLLGKLEQEPSFCQNTLVLGSGVSSLRNMN